MGKKNKAQGRAGQKKKAQKGSNGAQKAYSYLLDDMDENSHKLFRGFAQDSSRSLTPRESHVRLRHQAIAFVSAESDAPAESLNELATTTRVKKEDKINADVGEDDDDGDVELDIGKDAGDGTLQTNIITNSDMVLPQGALADMDISSTPNATTSGNDGDGDDDDYDIEVLGTDNASSHPAGKPGTYEGRSFFVDTVGDLTLDAGNKSTAKSDGKMALRPRQLSVHSDSSEDVVLFHGRNNKITTISDPVAPRSSHLAVSRPPQHSLHVPNSLPAARQVSNTFLQDSAPAPRGWAAKPSKYDIEQQEQSQVSWTPASGPAPWKKKTNGRVARPDLDLLPAETLLIEQAPQRKSKVMFAEPDKENKDGEETIPSLQAEVKQALREKKRAKEAARALAAETLDPASTPRSNRRGKRGRKTNNRQLRNEIVGAGDESDEDAAYDDYMANLLEQAQKEDGHEAGTDRMRGLTQLNAVTRSEAIGGPTLVVHGRAVPENQLLPVSLQSTEEDEEDWTSDSTGPIGQDLNELSDDDVRLNYSDLESSELEEELEYTEREQWEDEADLRQRRIDSMTDEQLARLFAKQQELGIDAEELIIDDGIYQSNDIDGVGDLSDARAGLKSITLSSSGRNANKAGRTRRRGNNDFSFPDASALADTVEQYGENGFDIMDFDRPSLRNTKKGRKGRLPPELEALSDDELKDEMLGAWENDRSKKRLKKAEREELRAQGLLGAAGKKGKADLRQKYIEGMTMKQVQEELRVFLQDDGLQSRPFPPMDKRDRKALHEIASAFNLKSKSVGTGNNRFPVLYKTSRTAEYSDHGFNRVMVASSRGFLKVSGKNGPGRMDRKARPGAGGGFSKAAAGLRNGEVVGAGAAEIGKDSFGHKLMEKMGWSKGMALGKDGEGLLLPVEQVMRSGKAGLG